MPYLDTAQSWLTQSTLLLQARPSTTRITTKYTILPPSSSNTSQAPTTTTTPSTSTSSKPEPPRANLTLKTYDPHSGTTLKYRTTKAAEVSRLIQILGRLARPMAGLSVLPLDMDTTVEAGNGGGTAEAQVGAGAGSASGGGNGGATAGGAGGKKNKKKGGKK